MCFEDAMGQAGFDIIGVKLADYVAMCIPSMLVVLKLKNLSLCSPFHCVGVTAIK
jgi:hypothetical protein